MANKGWVNGQFVGAIAPDVVSRWSVWNGVDLNTGLRCFWPLKESLDAFPYALDRNNMGHLIQSGTLGWEATNQAGLEGTIDFQGGNLQHASPAFTKEGAASGSNTHVTFWMSCFVWLDAKAGDMKIITRSNGTASTSGYELAYDVGTDRYIWKVSDGTTFTTVTANTYGSPAGFGWDFIVVWHDAEIDEIGIDVGNGYIDTTTHSGGVKKSGRKFMIGDWEGATAPLDGKMCNVGYWGASKPSVDQKTELYQLGFGNLFIG